ncbi:hypothetical protein Fcan01_12063 [Folsomia candida]|uniref:Uncharacterized protein n=1 Tax=Folsomia candida TaxID=158441 RepID=A0A226E7N0_FOLCA|nr:hypothetical protein Fcan01_12063 [Folsomia candida]
MYRFQGTNNRSNGIYCEPEAHFSPPHGNKKSSSKMRHHHRVRSNNRSAHLPHRNDSDPDSSSDVSDGTYQESSDVHGHGHPHSGMTMTNRDRLNMVAQNAEKKGLLDKGGGDEMGYDFPDKASFHYVVTLLQAALLLLRPVFIDGIIISPFFHGPKPIARAFLQGEGK